MSQIRYYTDEHVARAVIHGLRQRGIDVLSVPEADMLTASDEAHFAFAAAQGRVIFTQDTDFQLQLRFMLVLSMRLNIRRLGILFVA